ncbi:MAG TPA: YdeI/OmpD-associated family protein [Flavisolibacter sp.]|nr:YdeI/OmpD-associated family protein [Flavisolibacter sp.]
MATTNPWIDEYISKAAPFAQPILMHLRKLIHENCPNVVETKKWSFPHFEYKNSILCSMAAFKQHAAFTFWLGSIMKDPHGIMDNERKTAMGQFGQVKSLKDLPSDKIIGEYIRQAMELIDHGAKLPKAEKTTKPLDVPEEILSAFKRNKKAFENFEKFSSSHKKEYVQWITEAKTEATREKRLQTALEWIAEGKSRHWKYE